MTEDEERKAVIAEALQNKSAYYCDGVSIQAVTHPSGHAAFALVFWDRSIIFKPEPGTTREPKHAVVLLTVEGLKDVAYMSAAGILHTREGSGNG